MREFTKLQNQCTSPIFCYCTRPTRQCPLPQNQAAFFAFHGSPALDQNRIDEDPLMFALLLLEHLGRRLIFIVLPIATTGMPPGFFVKLVFVAVMIVGLVLSLRSQDNLQPPK